MNTILGLWDALVESLALIAIVVTVLGLMVRVIELGRGLQIIGSTLAALVLLVMLPAILIGIWHTLSSWQKLGSIGLLSLVGAVMYESRRIGRRQERKH